MSAERTYPSTPFHGALPLAPALRKLLGDEAIALTETSAAPVVGENVLAVYPAALYWAKRARSLTDEIDALGEAFTLYEVTAVRSNVAELRLRRGPDHGQSAMTGWYSSRLRSGSVSRDRTGAISVAQVVPGAADSETLYFVGTDEIAAHDAAVEAWDTLAAAGVELRRVGESTASRDVFDRVVIAAAEALRGGS